ncbi:hypothetical protein KA089_01700 [Candidatus Woesebacteria bacterium]|nr:hypothetical protein [Candidatus Woesebacteria bacterium]
MLSQVLIIVGLVLFFGTGFSALMALKVSNGNKQAEKIETDNSSAQIQLVLSYLGMAVGAIIFLLGLLEKGIRQNPF